MYLTALAFIAVAFLYASVGFGGGSTYTAILIESGLYWELVPPVSLLCNLVVVSGGVYHFAKAGHLNLRFAAPLIATSVPAAFLGGYLRLDESSFLQILGLALLVSGLLMLLDRRWRKEREFVPQTAMPVSLGLGLLLGGLAGITGIGGGIYLAPVLHLTRLAEAKTVAATCSLFILVNSLAGLAGQLVKLGERAGELLDVTYLLLPLAVLIGGQLGSRAGANWIQASHIRRLTGLVILVVSVRLLWLS
ncbi:MAG: sulfite exporter TauE/SafE family protein [Proteobacteria bacterium]|nr:sulfite exporter TauE/SafE family protein [Pseudomonadota bacterium]